MQKDQIYCDHAATTPLDIDVLKKMKPFFQDKFGNPSTLHSRGRDAKIALDKAKERVAKVLECDTDELVFTSGGTESDNLAIKGVAEKYGKPRTRMNRGHIIISAVEHHAVLDTAKYLEKQGFKITYLPVDKFGRVDAKTLDKAIKKTTVLVSVMYANNEVGTVQPIAEIGKICRQRNVVFHTDAVQAPGHLPLSVKKLNTDLMSFSGHKFYGPLGVGLLYVRKGVKVQSQNIGGGQEGRKRAGTENLAGIIGFAEALEKAEKERTKECARLEKLRKKLIDGVQKKIPDTQVNGHGRYYLPNIVHFSFAGIEGESLLLKLDEKGIMASTASACSSDVLEPSHVLKAMKIDAVVAHGSIRFSLGKLNDTAQIDYILKVLPKIVEELRDMSPVYKKGMLKK